ncbi:cation transporter [Sinorhizobium meliloti]|uniref:cation diffusion facilitator family transporter n=1 Tax=Rhizobium meliloti TaxID=382 RepID=UPI000414C5A6|nr:cation diffusion facilitator family transporter [Sinorhizobium meliloti]MDW9589532.1 cation transporter [Sinorhizobium meliloti]MDW9701278.1 cation transporter [Sinorhizobium meliloti]MDW9793655.1 cation transporter [Sinorhizobium meliloti]MDW9825313.1 cation diffusion facilitator family transporter [Sinorhizobium meliloti]MDW9856120.1 cation transporter [Sinorhizobium meliloti]
MCNEQTFLQASIAATVVVAAFGIILGLLSGSFSITFDGVYSLADAGMTVLALWVSKLIAVSATGGALSGRMRDRFTMGFWHLEPIVLLLNGTLLMAIAVYALINALTSVLKGGHQLQFGFAIAYAAVTVFVCAMMAVIGVRANRGLRSNFIALDVKAWIMSGGIASALLVAFIIGHAVQETALHWMTLYVDPVVLAFVCIVIIPLPIGTVKSALADILLITPNELRARVERIADETVRKQGFLSYRAYVARVGRAKQIELHFIVPSNFPPQPVESWDRIRDEIGIAIGDEGHNRWLTVAFTADERWAE